MEKIKYLIIFIVIIILLITCGLIYIITTQTSSEENVYVNATATANEENTTVSGESIKISDTMQEVTDNYTVLTVNTMINDFIDYIKQEDTSINNASFVLHVLSDNYVSENSITVDNAISYFSSYSQAQSSFMIKELYEQEFTTSGTTTGNVYYAKGTIIISGKTQVGYFIVRQDYANNTYSIEPIDEASYGNVQTVNETMVEIEPNTYNSILTAESTDYRLFSLLLDDYADYINYNPEEAFNMLDEEYRTAKFDNNYSKFQSYIEKNQSRYEFITISSYLKEEENGYVQYTIVDVNDYYYIFKLTKAFDYTILLDNYTIETEEYLQTYESATDANKVNTNILKFMKLINEKDYEKAYSLLDDDFKQANFSTLALFEQYASENFWDYNVTTITSMENISGVYVCTATISSGVSAAAEEMEKQFVVQLLDGTDFVMSFSV